MNANKISRQELAENIKNHKTMILVEALPKKYFQEEHLPSAINIPHDELDQLAPKLLPNKNAPIVVYCASLACKNSTLAAETLSAMGYTDVSDYEEGKQDWKDAGLKLEHGI